MPSLSKYTQWKVIGGYSLLFLLSILAAVLIYKQIIELTGNYSLLAIRSRGFMNRKGWGMLLYRPVRDPIF